MTAKRSSENGEYGVYKYFILFCERKIYDIYSNYILDVKCPSDVSALIKEMKEYKSSVSLFLHQHAYVFIPNICV